MLSSWRSRTVVILPPRVTVCYEEFAHWLEDRKFEKGQRMAKIRDKWRHFIRNEISQ